MKERQHHDSRTRAISFRTGTLSVLHSHDRKALLLIGKLGDRKCVVHILIRSRPLPRARWVARIACPWDQPGCICDFAAVAGMSVAATTRPIVTPDVTLKRRVIRSSRATTLPRGGAGATSMTSRSNWQARRRTTVQSRAFSEMKFDWEIRNPESGPMAVASSPGL
jgi:hypothetical protein